MAVISHIGTLANSWPYSALSPDASTLYVNLNDGNDDLVAFTYPGLTPGATVVTGTALGAVACDGDGEVYWWTGATVGADYFDQIARNPASPEVIFELPPHLSGARLAHCWSPYDDNIYVLVSGSADPTNDEGLWQVAKDGSSQTRVDATLPVISAGDIPCATPDGGIWWVKANPSGHIKRYDIDTSTIASASCSINDCVIPQPDGTVLAYGLNGTTRGWSIDPSLTFTADATVDVLSPGQRGVAYLPDASVCVVERRLTGEVWQIGTLVTGGWHVGKAGWGGASW